MPLPKNTAKTKINLLNNESLLKNKIITELPQKFEMKLKH